MNEVIILAGGCFWCTEAIYKRVNGVIEVIPGYTGGVTANPDYETVATGSTGHAEAVQIVFDSSIISLERLLDIFFATHDPTTLNRQGADTGSQYRSAIFYYNNEQKEKALKKIKELNSGKKFSNPIITEINKITAFYKAEGYHFDYYAKNPLAPYCSLVIRPKVSKLLENFTDVIKNEYR